MNSSINLVSTHSEAIEREQKILLTIRFAAVILLTSIALMSIVAFIITTQIPLGRIKSEQSQTLTQISAHSGKLSNYFLIKDRVKNVDLLLNSRVDYTPSIDSIFSKIPEEMRVDSMSIENKLIEMEMSSSSLQSIDQVINSLAGLGSEGKVIKSVKLKSITLNSGVGRYTVDFTAEIL
jgi:hypothetical protein